MLRLPNLRSAYERHVENMLPKSQGPFETQESRFCPQCIAKFGPSGASHPGPCPHGQIELQPEQLNDGTRAGIPFSHLVFDGSRTNSFLPSYLRPESLFDFDPPKPTPLADPAEEPKEPELEFKWNQEYVFEASFHEDFESKEHIFSKAGGTEPTNKPISSLKSHHAKRARSNPPPPLGTRRCRRAKAKEQYLRDYKSRSSSLPLDVYNPTRTTTGFGTSTDRLGPKRKHCAFVQEQEIRCLIEDRVGTPHLSELLPGDHVNGQLTVDELGVGGGIAAINVEDQILLAPSVFPITDIPHEKSNIS